MASEADRPESLQRHEGKGHHHVGPGEDLVREPRRVEGNARPTASVMADEVLDDGKGRSSSSIGQAMRSDREEADGDRPGISGLVGQRRPAC
jgi:hypothetical protein